MYDGLHVCRLRRESGTFESYTREEKISITAVWGLFATMEENGSKDRYFQGDAKKLVQEGVRRTCGIWAWWEDTVFQLLGGLRSGMGYCGAADNQDASGDRKLYPVSAASLKESHPHDIHITKEAQLRYRINTVDFWHGYILQWKDGLWAQ